MRDGTNSELLVRLDLAVSETNRVLDAALGRLSAPARLVDAMRHAVFAGGKRVRPFLVLESARLFGIEGQASLTVAAALECVHCYSLVHDDLPVMDDDDLRRGLPTVHRAFDEATAILAGDALLTLSFSLLSTPGVGLSAAKRMRLIRDLAHASGADGMVGGQMLDLAAEGRFCVDGKQKRRLTARSIRQLQAMKTGALIAFAATAGATIAPRVSAGERRALATYGDRLGLAFQIRDDLLDIEGQASIVGKAVSKDVEAGKATFASLLGVEGARQELARAGTIACAALDEAFGTRAQTLIALVAYNEKREK